MLTGIPATALKRDRVIALTGLIVITALAWVYTIHATSSMMGMDQMSKPMTQDWGTADLLLTFSMWAVMMAAMMTPSVTPMILTFAGIKRRRQPDATPIPAVILFLLGYLIAWSIFSAAATLLQWGLHSTALLSDNMSSVSALFNGIVLLLAGIYQLTPLKNMCLSHCRTPFGFLMNEWQDGAGGVLRLGVRHGFYCIGCCWLLMALLFVAGVMNLLWSAILAGIVMVEKTLPGGQWVSRAVGLLAAGWGTWILARAAGM